MDDAYSLNLMEKWNEIWTAGIQCTKKKLKSLKKKVSRNRKKKEINECIPDLHLIRINTYDKWKKCERVSARVELTKYLKIYSKIIKEVVFPQLSFFLILCNDNPDIMFLFNLEVVWEFSVRNVKRMFSSIMLTKQFIERGQIVNCRPIKFFYRSNFQGKWIERRGDSTCKKIAFQPRLNKQLSWGEKIEFNTQ